LTLVGYQVEYAVLQAGEYGTPQNRQRVIFWAALQGHDLPDFPQATTTFERCSSSWHRTRSSAPHRGLTVADAIFDLPRFDWVNPHNEVPATDEERKDRLEMAKDTEQIEVLQKQKFVGQDEQNYATSPHNEFQRNIRNGVSKLTNHVTKSWFDRPSRSKQKKALSHARTEQVCNIGMKAGTDHMSLPQELKPWYTYHANSAAKKNNFYKAQGRFGRLDAETHFPICLTTVNPNSKNGRVCIDLVSFIDVGTKLIKIARSFILISIESYLLGSTLVLKDFQTHLSGILILSTQILLIG
jgi:DNA (cytosine-5)-methyltransferase 1